MTEEERRIYEQCRNVAYKPKEPQEQTNEEYLRSCSTEELARWIIGERMSCVYHDCPNGETPCLYCTKDGCDKDDVIAWLKEIHDGKDEQRKRQAW